jgi:Ser/Thr protein kinase RdoA (MazF antagonist)
MTTSVKILRSVVAPETVARVLENELGFPNVSCRFLHHGFNDTYEAQSQGTPLIVRLYRHKWRSEKQIASECKILHELSAAGLAVSVPISGPSGAYRFALDAPEGLRLGVVFSCAEGNIPLNLGSGDTCRLGRILGTLHDRLDCLAEVGADRPILGSEFFLNQPFKILRRAFPANEADIDRLELHLRKGTAKLPPFSGTRPDFGLVHGDFLRVNIFQNDAGDFTLFDFDFSGFSHRSYDLATYRWSLGPLNDPELKPLWIEFLSGYEEVHPLSPTELSYLDWFIQIRQLWVWSINVDTGDGFQRLNQHQFKARLAWFGL